MRRTLKLGTLLAASVTVAAGLTPSSSAQIPELSSTSRPCPEAVEAANGESKIEQEDLPEGTDVEACDLVGSIVVNGDAESAAPIGVEIPEPGFGSEFSVFTDAGDEEGSTMYVGVLPDGALTYDEPDVSPRAAAPSACNDDEYNLAFSGPMVNNEEWTIRQASIPSNLSTSDTVEEIRLSMRAWLRLYTDCQGIIDNIDQTATYAGNSNAGTSITNVGPDSVCGSTNNDTVSQVEFGVLQGAFGATCRHFGTSVTGNQITYGADVRLNSYAGWTLNGDSSSCSNRRDLPSVMTHEAGHWFGLDHVDVENHPSLTMRNGGTAAITCNTYLRTLGKGDIYGMRAIYN